MAGHLNLGSRLQTFTGLILLTSLFLYIHPPTLALVILAISIDEYHRCVRQLPNAILPLKPLPSDPLHPAPNAAARALPYTTGSRAFHVLCASLICLSALYGPTALTACVLAVNAFILTHSLLVNSFTQRPLTTAALVMIGDLFGHVYLSFLWSHCLLYFQLPTYPAYSPASLLSSATPGAFFARHPLLLVLYPLTLTALGENAALFVGRAVGRHPLASAISPNKSVEGAVAQLLGSVAASLAYAQLLLPVVGLHDSVVIGAIVGVMGIVGDLFESFLKRAVNVKDVGSILPGTGGFLDRVDGLTLTFPAVYYYVRLRYGI